MLTLNGLHSVGPVVPDDPDIGAEGEKRFMGCLQRVVTKIPLAVSLPTMPASPGGQTLLLNEPGRIRVSGTMSLNDVVGFPTTIRGGDLVTLEDFVSGTYPVYLVPPREPLRKPTTKSSPSPLVERDCSVEEGA